MHVNCCHHYLRKLKENLEDTLWGMQVQLALDCYQTERLLEIYDEELERSLTSIKSGLR